MSEITILDGSMGQELVKRAPEDPTPLWGTKVLIDHPDIVRAVHDDYFAAGADIATLNSYAILHDRLEKFDLDDKFAELHRAACQVAIDSRDAHGSGSIAGSLGPLGWSYRADMAPPIDEAAALYAEIAELQSPMVDLFIAETMSGLDQAEGALKGAAQGKKPVWVACSVDDEDGTKFRNGDPLTGILDLATKYEADAILINCSIPEAVTQGVPELVGKGFKIGCYANGFTKISSDFAAGQTTVDLLKARQDLTPSAYADFAERWAEMGATIIGGCCEVGPAHISEIKRRLV